MKAAPSSRTDTESILTLMFEVGRMIRHACIADDAASLPLSYLETLRFIGAEKDPTMRDIAGYLRITAPSATAIVEALVKESFITRREDAKDRRLVRLSLSAKGKQVIAKTMQTRMKVLRGIVGSLSASDRRELKRILSLLMK